MIHINLMGLYWMCKIVHSIFYKTIQDIHRENSPVTQTTPEPTVLTWGGWPREKYFPHPWQRSQTWSYHTYQAIQTPLFPKPLMLPIDTQVCHKHQICLRFHQILKVILEMAFSAHCTSIWKLNGISRTSISKILQKCIWCCCRVQRCVTAPHWVHRWGKTVQWCMKAWSR